MEMMGKITPSTRNRTLNCHGRLLVMDRPLVMGIINLTPDSFHDGGRLTNTDEVLRQAERMILEGADILDIGAYSSRPGAADISGAEESDRLLPALKAVRSEFPDAFISIDTFRSEVAAAALDEGADIINDISAGDLDPQLPGLAARHCAPYIAMHMRGTPQTMQRIASEGPILAEVLRYFSQKVQQLKATGLHDIILDPGFGFGKTLAQNYELARHLPELGMWGHPVLVGVSRKSMVNRAIGTTPETALNGTTALHALLLDRGADILRVHDVKEAVEAVKLHIMLNGHTFQAVLS